MGPERYNPAAEPDPRKVEQDIRKMEQSLFADTHPEKDEGIGLFPDARREERPVGEKEIVLKVNPSRIWQRTKKGLFWIVIVVLAVSFFYNPFYTYFPWNNGLTGAAVAEEIVYEDVVENSTVEAPVEEPPAPPVEEAVVPEENNSVVEPATPAAPSTLSGAVGLNITDVEVVKTDYGWKIGKVSFEIDNGKKAFAGKIRARGFNNPTMQDLRGDKFLVLGMVESGKRISNSLVLNAMYNEAGDRLLLVELYDDGDKSGKAGDLLMAKATKLVRGG